ncbi:LCP family protein [Brachybacterium sp. EF45031]|uniref:LCP family protein n=1 Tax=Brachybacterium sillae TaxID=2810536 RepID=UPI00217D590A|nr:LCP family protein [Brachybacterium sillae]MCS6712267.1 LCP family protein [Brachybacterium sillae]
MSEQIDLPGWEDDDRPRRRRRRRRGPILIVLGLVALLVLGAGGWAGWYALQLKGDYDKRTTVSLARSASDGARPQVPAGSGTNYLLLGSDRRDPEEARLSGVVGQRSDVMMLVHVSDDKEDVYVLSFPRDLWVDIPGHGKERINAALAFGGVPLTVTTVENYVGVPIDHVAMIDFQGIQGLVDTLGGVDVEVPQTFEADGKSYTEGVQHMDGETALVFVRQRKQFADGDFQRNRNQQALLRGITQEILARDTLSSPTKVAEMVGVITPFLTTDDALTAGRMVQLGWGLREVRGENIHYLSVPHGGPFMTSGGASVVATDEQNMNVLRTALREDDMGTYYSNNAGKW